MREKLVARARNTVQSDIRAVTRLIESVGGINLGQGTCALPPHPEVTTAAKIAIDQGHNSYTLFDGIPSLKSAIAHKSRAYNKLPISAENVLVTSGATGAFECICKCFLEEGDEVVVFEPIYQYHVRQARNQGATIRYVRLYPPEWTFDPQELAAAFSERTKLFVFSNPNNPCGKVFTRDELSCIGELCTRHNVIAVVDEVYEYILAEGEEQISLASLPGMFERTLTISSASKTFFVTGWRVGWAIGPEEILGPLGVKSDETYVCAPAPFQHAIAHTLSLPESFFTELRSTFQTKRSRLLESLRRAGLEPYAPPGAYYILARYPRAFGTDDVSAMRYLIERRRIASVPGREFFPTQDNTGMLRFCFALTDEVLEQGCARLTSGNH